MSEQNENTAILDRVERLAKQAGVCEYLLNEKQKHAEPAKPIIDASILNHMHAVIENQTACEDDYSLGYAMSSEQNFTLGDLRKLYEALK